ncbi:Chain A, Structural Studies On The Synchronization Of Catalytic [Sesbania bispinosa]|nr:Chain A, Structural Studies On The Synchronization Of Catalytic [Sesbania bispinosa]
MVDQKMSIKEEELYAKNEEGCYGDDTILVFERKITKQKIVKDFYICSFDQLN